MSDERPAPAAAARVPADLTGRDQSHTLAGLIDVLDRADGTTARRRPHPRHAAAARAAAYRSGAVRTVPLRSVRPAPPARPAPVPFRPAPVTRALPAAAPATTPGLLGRLTRRVAFWGAGPGGAYLAWQPAAAPAAPVPPRKPSEAAPSAGRRRAHGTPGFLGALVRRAAFWGAGQHGEYLAWSAAPLPRPVSRISLRAVEGPVVLRELPSTPTVQPVASSPAPALVPGPVSSPAEPVAPPAPIGHRPPAPPVVASESAGPRVPVQSARTPQPTGWPQRPLRSSRRPARSFPTATGLARARGDPTPCRTRGSPRPPPCRAPRPPG